MNLKNLNKKKSPLLSDRLFIICIVVALMFAIITYQFYKIQIIDHAEYDQELRATVQKKVDIPAVRGTIYDRYGIPLAINKAVYVVKIDPQAALEKGVLDRTLLKLANLLQKNGDTYIDVVPVSGTAPFIFTEDKKTVERFITNYVPYDNTEQKEKELYKYSPAELIAYLRGEKVFNIDASYSDEDARKIIAMRLQMRKTTFQKYVQVTLAQDIKMESLVAIEENQDEYPSIFTEVESQRYYPYKEAFGNILGYTRTITESQYAEMKDKGYDQDDIVGQVGIESTQEAELKGKKGSKLIEVDNVGRTVYTDQVQEATAGNDVYLTLDARLQQEVYNALEQRLTNALIERLQGTSSKAKPLSGHDILVSMAKNNQLDLNKMEIAPENSACNKLYKKIIASYKKAEAELEEKEKDLPDDEKTNLNRKQHFADMLESEDKPITDQELLLAMGEQKTLQFTDEQMAAIRAGNYNTQSLLINLFQKGLLKPDQMNITPCSGSAIIVDPNTGQVLALASYPSYDNNKFIENFNDFYNKLHDGVDDRNIEINRALKTAKAPGSTFKMVTAMAGLEEGVITPNTQINDVGVYNNAGPQGPKCWIFENTGHGHGFLNVEQALEVSCNYFFNDVAYRLVSKYGSSYMGMDKLANYAKKFGLGEKTGIELEEATPTVAHPYNLVSNLAGWSLRNLKGIKGESKEALYNKLTDYLDSGFYTRGDSNGKTVDEQIDYLSRSYIKDNVDPELGIALSEDFKNIFDKVLGDINDGLKEGIGTKSGQIAEEVMKGDENISLKNRTITVMNHTLKEMIQPGTKKTIIKAINKMPDGFLRNIYLEGYKATLKEYQNAPNMQEVNKELKSRIAALEADTYDYQSVMADKVLDRILNVYLEDYFKDKELFWNASLNIRAGMGQANNAYTPVQMARYIAGLTNGETVYNLTIINGIKDNKETNTYKQKEASVFSTLNFDKEYLKVIYSGMHDVVSGSSGTARQYFQDMKFQVAGKTGTAQANEGEASVFVGFAPYENPEISIVTSMYGTDGLGSNNTLLARDLFEIYYRVNETVDKTTLNSQFTP